MVPCLLMPRVDDSRRRPWSAEIQMALADGQWWYWRIVGANPTKAPSRACDRNWYRRDALWSSDPRLLPQRGITSLLQEVEKNFPQTANGANFPASP